MVERVVLYFDKSLASGFAERVKFALEEVGAKYEIYEVPILPAPAFYREKINPIGKVPAITYGGPEVPGDQPSPESAKIVESLVILEFLADIFPESGLLPADPVERAKVRFFNTVSEKFPTSFVGFFFMGTGPDGMIEALEGIQKLIRPGSEVAVGDKFTIADAALAPMLWRLEMALDRNVGAFSSEERKRVLDLYKSDHFSTLREYFEKIKARKAFKESIRDQDSLVEFYTAQFAKAQQK